MHTGTYQNKIVIYIEKPEEIVFLHSLVANVMAYPVESSQEDVAMAVDMEQHLRGWAKA